jgi:diguanylate cyclase (GGDEF)-like protein/PAS domain S-box-containing protein
MLDSVAEAVVATDAAARVIYWNTAAERLYGWPAVEVIGRPVSEILGTLGSQASVAVLEAAGRGETWSGDFWARRRDATRFPVHTEHTPLFGANGELVAVIGVSSDLTERRVAEALQRRLSAIVESSTDAIVSKTLDGVIITWNSAASRVYGFTAEEAVGRHISIIVPPTRLTELEKIMKKVAIGQATERLLTVRRGKDGREVQVMVSVVPLVDDDGEVIGASTVTHDMTERVVAKHARQLAEARFQAAFHQSPFGMMVTDLTGRPTAVNPAACAMLGRDAEELVNRSWAPFVHPDDVALAEPAVLAAILAGQDPFGVEQRYLRPDGSMAWLQVNFSVVRGPDDEPSYLMVQMQDISERRLMQQQLQHQALHDDLTGLPNRALLNDRLEHALAAQGRTGRRTGVIFLDVDRFKYINDALGHPMGDRLLIEVGQRLRSSVRPTDTVARFGGDEFVVVSEEVTTESMVALAQRVTAALALPFLVDSQEIAVHASLGITLSRPTSTSQSLLSEADAAMYRAKELGRDQAAVFDDSLLTRATALVEGERRLGTAISRGEVVPYYQPIVDIQTEKAVGVEALARWQLAEGEVVMPADFIPMAEASGLIVSLGRLVLSQAVTDVARWNADAPGADPLWVSVNLSGRQLVDGHLSEMVVSILDQSGLAPSLLHLEITETVVMENIGQFVSVLEELKSLGVRLSIDDFGTGYSSLSYLHQLPVDTLKIDRSFVHNLGGATDGSSIVKAIINLGHSLGMLCVAEGVETRQQHSALAELACQLGQGFLWSHPLSAAQAIAWAGQRAPG